MLSHLLLVFSFLSFNTRAMMPGDSRLESTAALLRDSGADFVYLTEEYSGQLSRMLADVYPYSGTARSHIDETERFLSRYPIVDVETVAPLESGGRVDVWVHRVRVLLPEGSGRDTLSLYCCHLPHGLPERVGIVREILRDISEEPGSAGGSKGAVVGGDMNSLPLSIPMLLLSRGGLSDSWAEKGSGDGATFHGLPLGVRIDHIFHSSSLCLRRVRRIGASHISDHDALLAEFSFR